MKNIQISDVVKKQLKILAYLLASGVLGYVLSLIANKPELTVILTPAINFAIYWLVEELKKEGYVQAVKNKLE